MFTLFEAPTVVNNADVEFFYVGWSWGIMLEEALGIHSTEIPARRLGRVHSGQVAFF